MEHHHLHERHERLWMPVIAPVIWSTHFTVCYVAAALWCGRFGRDDGSGLRTLIAVFTVIAVAGIVAMFVHGWRQHQYQLPRETHDDDTPEDRHHFLAWTTTLLAGLSLLATMFVAVAFAVIGGCG
jgi:hypothetical protein